MNILIVGDIYSKLGRTSFEANLNKLKQERNINFVIVNGENTSHGKGLNENHYKWYMEHGVNVITLGNHSYHNRSIFRFIDSVNNLVRPYNLPSTCAGKGYCVINYNNIKICVFQLMGQVFMNNDTLSSPFACLDEILENVKADIYLCDFHGEATSEKVAFGYYADSKINAVFGTHTHVPTCDERILKGGTAYITDIGMTGPLDGVIGTKASIIVDRFVNKSQNVFEPEDTGDSQFNAIILEIDDKSFKTVSIERINIVDKRKK